MKQKASQRKVNWSQIKRVASFVQTFCICLGAFLLFVSLCSTGFLVGSDSMEPTIQTGDFVLLWTVTQPEKLKEGDIAGYVSGTGNTVIHRTVTPYLDEETNRVAWRMKGDANDGLDVEVLTVNNFVGKMVFQVHHADSKWFKTILSSIYAVPILLVSLAGLLKVYADMKLSGKGEKKTEKSTKEEDKNK